jgi:EAL domain-containing protein (putative c-di-GMP-specific phosphodiesterase class I)
LGGDSFVAYLPDYDADQASVRADAIVHLASRSSVGSADAKQQLSLSCGVTSLPDLDLGLAAYLNFAELACKAAKRHGGGRCEIHVSESPPVKPQAQFQAQDLRDALVESRFCVYAQKIMAAADQGELRRIECLVRMIDEQGRLVPPGDFLPSAQHHALLQSIDHWVISKTLKELRAYRNLLQDAQIIVSINISGQSIQDELFVELLERWLLESMVSPDILHFEITETAAITNLSRAERLTRRLRQYGCGISLDDFCATPESLSLLKSLPVTCVKIDGSITRDLLSSPQADEAIQTIVQMSRYLNIECVAECVESQLIAARLRELSVDLIQGFVLHRPEPLRDVLEALKNEASQRLQALYLAR